MPLPRPKRSGAKPRRSRAGEWEWLEQRLAQVEGAWCVGEEILNLPGWRTEKYYETADDIVVIAAQVADAGDSCGCAAGGPAPRLWGRSAASYFHDLPTRCKRTRVYFRQQRYRCACGKTFQRLPADVHERYAMTLRLARYIEREAFSIFRTFSGVADEAGVSEHQVRNIFTACGERLEKDRRVEPLQWVAVDEVHAGKKEYSVITDPIRRRVIDLVPRDDQKSLWGCLLQLPGRDEVQVVTMDMSPAYRRLMKRLLPRAAIVVDRYHVHNLLSVALKGVLQVVRDSMTHTEQRRHMRHEHLLLSSRYHLSGEAENGSNGRGRVSQIEVVKRWLKDVPDVATAYWLKEDFSDILQLPDRRQAEERTDLWLERVWEFVKYFRGRYEREYGGRWEDPFGNVPSTVISWRAMILNYIDYKDRFEMKATNAFAEFANRQIKKAYRLCNGLNFDVLRMKVVHGGLLVRRRPAHPADAERPQARRVRSSRVRKARGGERNPNANVVRLERARQDRDETKKLMPNPSEHEGWADRFGELDQFSLGFEAHAEELRRRRRKRGKGKTEKPPVTSRRSDRSPLKHNPDQLKMF